MTPTILSLIASIAAGTGAGSSVQQSNCAAPSGWDVGANADRDRAYVNETDGVYLLEYTPDTDGGSHLGSAPIWISFPVTPGQIYRLRTRIRTGNGQSFRYEVRNAVRLSNGQVISGQLGEHGSVQINRAIRATGPILQILVRGEHYVKFWSFVGPTTLCLQS